MHGMSNQPRDEAGRFRAAYGPDDLHPDPLAVRERILAILRRNKAELRPGPRTQVELAARVGLPKVTLHSALSGRRPLPRAMVEQLAEALGVPPREIAG